MCWIPAGPLCLTNLKSWKEKRICLLAHNCPGFYSEGDPEVSPAPMSSSAVHLHHCQHKGDRCSPTVNMDAARSKNMKNVEGRIWKGNRKFWPFYTCHFLQKEGVAVGFLDFQKYVWAMHTLSDCLKGAFYLFKTFRTALERVYIGLLLHVQVLPLYKFQLVG